MTDVATNPAFPALLADRAAYKARLEIILPAELTGRRDASNDVAGAAAFALMYVGAVGDERLARPSMVTLMSDGVAERRADADRLAWHRAASRGRAAVLRLVASWQIEHRPWYADNSREGIRDETFRTWALNGALRVDETVSTTSGRSRYSLDPAFAALLAPDLAGAALDDAVTAWQDEHLTKTGLLRVRRLRQAQRRASGVTATLPGGGTRELMVGPSSLILKGVIEGFTRHLIDPVVVFVSQSGEKVSVLDDELLRHLGLRIDQRTLLPDAFIADLAPERDEFWFVEIDATGGPVDEQRKSELLLWAATYGIDHGKCRFLTAFASRTHPEARKALPNLALGTYAWFDDEPDALLAWIPARDVVRTT